MVEPHEQERIWVQAVNTALAELLPGEEEKPSRLHAAMRYSTLAGGKRLRPVLLLAAADLVAGDWRALLPAACSLELVHTYSLIHDDLPAMDDDDYRRGRPTCHKVYGEAVAILAGDALLTLAFELLTRPLPAVEPGRQLAAAAELARAAGSRGMVGGQVLDLAAEGRAIGLPELEGIHLWKTGALFRAALRMGGLLGGADDAALEALDRYAAGFGLAFQITDDILDVTGDAREMGKTPGSDARKQKATYPALLGLDQAKKKAAEAAELAAAALTPFGPRGELLQGIVRRLVGRTK